MYEGNGFFSGESQTYVWGMSHDGEDTTWFDMDGDDDDNNIDLLRASMVLNYIGLGFAALTILGVFFRDGMSHWGAILSGVLMFVSMVLFFFGNEVNILGAETGLALYFLSVFFAISAKGHAMRRF